MTNRCTYAKRDIGKRLARTGQDPRRRNAVSEKHKIKINLTAALHCLGSSIEIDGNKIPYVTSIRVDAKVKEVTKITLELLALDGVEIAGEVSNAEVKETEK